MNTGRQLVEVPMRYELEHNHHLSPEAAYMTVVHELAHLIEMNHSKAFWQKVESVYRDYQVARRQLREYI